VPGILSRTRVKKGLASPSETRSQKSGTETETETETRTLHFAAEDPVTDEYTLSLGANLLLWGFPLALIILVVAETLLDTWWREPRR
jgi:hypothetical protein